MLYDPKWEKTETKADPLSLASLIAWLEQQPADETYCYMDCGRCLAAKYNESIGREYTVTGWPPGIALSDLTFDQALEKIAVMGVATFGAALERARAGE